MPGKATTDTVRHIHYLAAALKAPRIIETTARLADQARDAGGPTRTTSPQSSSGKYWPAKPPAPSCASAPPGSPQSRP